MLLEIGEALKDLKHCSSELFKADRSVSVLVDGLKDLFPGLFCTLRGLGAAKDCVELFLRDLSVTILVEHVESSRDIPLGKKFDSVIGGRHKLGVVDSTITIAVSSCHHRFQLTLTHVKVDFDLGQILLDLVPGEETIVVVVPFDEKLTQLPQLFAVAHHVGHN